MGKKICIVLFYLCSLVTNGQYQVFTDLENYDTIGVKKYLEQGGDIDLVRQRKVNVSAYSNKRTSIYTNLYEQALMAINNSFTEEVPDKKIKAYRNLDLLLDKINQSKNKQKVLDRVFTLSIATGDVDLVRKIQQMGANINYKCDLCYGRTPILISLGYNDNYELIRFLLSLKPDLTATDYDRKGFLHYAVQNNNLPMVRYYLENVKGSIDEPDKHGRTALMYATGNGNFEIFNYLVEKGASLQAKTKKGYTVLHSAAASHNVDFFRHVHYISGLPLWYKGWRNEDVSMHCEGNEEQDEQIRFYIVRYTIEKYGEAYYRKRIKKEFFKRIF